MVTGWIINSEVQQVFAKHVTVVARLVTVILYCVHLVMRDTTSLVHIVYQNTTLFYKLDSTWITMLYSIFWTHFCNGLSIKSMQETVKVNFLPPNRL